MKHFLSISILLNIFATNVNSADMKSAAEPRAQKKQRVALGAIGHNAQSGKLPKAKPEKDLQKEKLVDILADALPFSFDILGIVANYCAWNPHRDITIPNLKILGMECLNCQEFFVRDSEQIFKVKLSEGKIKIKKMLPVKHGDMPRSICLLPTGKLVVGYNKHFIVFDIETKKVEKKLSYKIQVEVADPWANVFRLHKNLLAAGLADGKVIFFDANTFEKKHQALDNYEGYPLYSAFSGTRAVQSLCFITDDILAVGLANGQIIFWNLSKNNQFASYNNASTVTALELSGNILIAGLADGNINLWNIENNELVRVLQTKTKSPITSLKLLENKTLIASTQNGHILYFGHSIPLKLEN